jgi:Tol biopolymer transport system component
MTALPGGAVTKLDVRGIRPLAVLDGAVVYVQADGAVMAVRVDASRKRVRGRPVPVLDPVPVSAAVNGNSGVFVSRGGALVSALGTHHRRLVWLGRDGRGQPISPDVRDFSAPRLSPDGRRIAVIVQNGSKSDVWILDLSTGTLSRLTTAETVASAEWTRDGTRVVYSAVGRGSRGAIWAQPIGMESAPELLVETPEVSPTADIAPDRRSLLVESSVDQGLVVLRVALDSGRALRPFSGSRTNDFAPRFSPDGHWAAVVSFESGGPEVYVRSFPVPTVKVQVSVGGGGEPVWGGDGTRLYYRSGDAIVGARLATTPALHVLTRDTVFGDLRSVSGGGFGANYDVSRDGSRLLVPVSQSEAYQLIVVPNWLSEFRERLGAGRN